MITLPRYGTTRAEFLRTLLVGDVWFDIGTGAPDHTIFDELYPYYQGNTVVCCDISDGLLERENHELVTYIVADMRQCRFGNIGLLTLFHSIEHIALDDARMVLNDAQAHVTRIIVETPDKFEDGVSVVNRTGNKHQAHLSHITPEFMTELGFERVAMVPIVSDSSNSIYLWNKT